MSNLIALVVIDQEPRVDSRIIANQLGVKHISVRELIDQYLPDFEEFGKPRFQTEASGKTNQQQKFYLLNEDQSYLLLTYSQNTEQARDLNRLLITLEAYKSRMYDVWQVLVTLTQAAIRSVIAAFLFLPHWFAPLGDGLVRKAGRPTCVGLRTSPANAFVSVEKASTRSILV